MTEKDHLAAPSGEAAPKFTRGPWAILPAEFDCEYLRVRGTRLGERYKVANVHWPRFFDTSEVLAKRDEEETRANANLIAAAPDLYAALSYAVDNPEFDSATFDSMARAALAKARGE